MRWRGGRRCTGRVATAGLASVLALAGGAALASAELTGPEHRLRGAHFQAAGAPRPGAGGSGLSLGSPAAAGPAGHSGDLRSVYPGFWPIVAGHLADLDLDGDAVPAFLDPDDDGDALADEVETNTGFYAGPDDTGTDPSNPDSDGDGFADGVEVALGSDPTRADSTPFVAPIPTLPTPALWLTALGCALAAAVRSGPRRSPR